MNYKPHEDPLYARIRAQGLPLWGVAKLIGADSPDPSTLSRMLRNIVPFPAGLKAKIEEVLKRIEQEKNSHDSQ